MILKIAATFIVVLVFAVMLEIPKHLLLYAGLVGAFAQSAMFVAGLYTKNTMVQVFMGALMIALVSHIFARALKAPASVFLVAGILPIVPGEAIYRAVYYFIRGNQNMVNLYFSKTLSIAGAIALAIFIMDSAFTLLSRKREEARIRRKKREKEAREKEKESDV